VLVRTVGLVTLDTGECGRVIETGTGRNELPCLSLPEERCPGGGESLGVEPAALQLFTPARDDFHLVGMAVWDLFKLVGKAPLCLCYGLCSQPELIHSGTQAKLVLFPTLVCTELALSDRPLAKRQYAFELPPCPPQGESIPLFLTELFISSSFTLVL